MGMVIAILTVLSGVPSSISISDDCSQQKETAENVAWRRETPNETSSNTMQDIQDSEWNPDGTGVICRSERPADADGTGAFCRRESSRHFLPVQVDTDSSRVDSVVDLCALVVSSRGASVCVCWACGSMLLGGFCVGVSVVGVVGGCVLLLLLLLMLPALRVCLWPKESPSSLDDCAEVDELQHGQSCGS